MYVEELSESLKDELTQLYSRKALDFVFQNEVRKSKRYGTKFSLMLIDLDDFSLINNLAGHREGDRLLYEFAQYLKKTLRESDLIFRIGGDEFLVILPHTEIKNAKAAGERILRGLRSLGKSSQKISASIGIVEVPTHGTEWQMVYFRLDHALFKAKKQGKGTIYAISEEDHVIPVIPAPLFVGRKAEKAQVLTKLQDPNVKIIAISGTVGVGKTRLADEIIKHEQNSIVAKTKAGGGINSIPFYPFKNIYISVRQTYFLHYKEAFEALDELEKAVLSIIEPERSYTLLNVDRYKFYDTFQKFLTNLAHSTRVIIFIDDLHWADSDSIELLYYLSHSENPAIKFFVTYRKEEFQSKPVENFYTHCSRERLIHEIPLENLTDFETFELVEAILQAKCDAKIKEFIYKKTGGNPFFVEELIKELYRNGAIEFKDGTWIFVSENQAQKFFIPETVENAIKQKLKNFEGNKILEFAACLGNEFNVKTLETVLGERTAEIYDVLDKLIKNRIILEKQPDVFTFKEDIAREIVLSNISDAKKKFIHQHILESLEKVANKLKISYTALSNHAILAENKDKILEYSLKAGRELKSIFALSEAVKHYKAYIQHETDPERKKEAFYEYLDVLIALGEFNKALGEIREFANTQPLDPELLFRFADIYSKVGNIEESLKLIDKAISEDKKPKFLLKKAWILIFAGNYDEASELLNELKEMENSLQDEEKATLYNHFGLLLTDTGNYPEAERYFLMALNIRENEQDKRGIANVCLNLGNLHANLEDLDKALECYEKAYEIYNLIGDKRGILGSLNNKSEIYRKKREYDLAIEGLKEAIRIASQIGDIPSKVTAMINLASLFTEIDEIAEAEKWLKDARETHETQQIPIAGLKAFLYNSLFKLHACSSKRKEEALQYRQFLENYFTTPDGTYSQVELLLDYTDSLICLKDYEKALSFLKTYENMITQEIKTPSLRIRYLFQKAICCFHLNDRESQKEAFKQLGTIKRMLTRKFEKILYFEQLANYFRYVNRNKGIEKVLEIMSNLMEMEGDFSDQVKIKKLKEKLLRGEV